VVIEGGYTPIVWRKELYVGTVPASGNEPMSYAVMSDTSCLQRSSLTPSELYDSSSDVRSLGGMNPAAIMDPSAPTQATMCRQETCSAPPHGGIYPSISIAEEERPPPFAPGHGDDLLYQLAGGDDPVGTPPSAPSSVTLMRPWSTEETSGSFNTLNSPNHYFKFVFLFSLRLLRYWPTRCCCVGY